VVKQAPLLLTPECCSRCSREASSFVNTVRGRVCSTCYYELGQPPGPTSTPEEVEEATIRIRERMGKRSGADANRVRKGV
jgi:hypothetical protein